MPKLDGQDPDGELIDFQPWSQFESAATRDWQRSAAPAVAVAVVVLAAGWFAWRSTHAPTAGVSPAASQEADVAARDESAVPAESLASGRTPEPGGTTVPETIIPAGGVIPSEAVPLLSEADLMAGPGDQPNLAVVSAAEEAVFQHFTTRALDERDSGPPGYVEWARVVDLRSFPDEFIVSVRFSVIASAEDPWRLPIRTVELTMRPEDGGWSVVGLPRLLRDPSQVQWAIPELVEVPQAVREPFEHAGWSVVGGVRGEDGWQVAVADPTGATMMIAENAP